MDKRQAAAQFFAKLGDGSQDFITTMIEAEMDAELIELFNQLGGQLQIGDMDAERYQTSLLIIGYLVRAYEQELLAGDSPEDAPAETSGGGDSVMH